MGSLLPPRSYAWVPEWNIGDAIIIGGPEGVKIVPNPQRIQALCEIHRPRSRKEVQVYLGTVRSLIKWFPSLNISTPKIGANILKGRVFECNELMEEEFIEVRKKVGEPHVLSP